MKISQEKIKIFALFFSNNSNIEQFCKNIVEIGISARDYYLYFLHSVGISDLNKESYFVSTSLNFNVAKKYAIGDDFHKAHKSYIVCYIIPEPKEKHAVSPFFNMPIEEKLKNIKLPTFEGLALHPDQKEVGIKRTLFSSFILGLIRLEDESLVINPYFFCDANTVQNIITRGMYLDQSNFEKKMKSETRYNNGVCLILDENRYEKI